MLKDKEKQLLIFCSQPDSQSYRRSNPHCVNYKKKRVLLFFSVWNLCFRLTNTTRGLSRRTSTDKEEIGLLHVVSQDHPFGM